ncbi:MAG: dockerin type I domain-containing protein, partial [Clostridium sp.]
MNKNSSNTKKLTVLSLSSLLLLSSIQPVQALSNSNEIVPYASIPEDLNGDGKVNNLDLEKLSLSYNSKTNDPQFNLAYDLTKDGLIDIFDIVKLSSKFTVSTDTAAPADFQIAKDNWDGAKDYTISMNLWFG